MSGKNRRTKGNTERNKGLGVEGMQRERSTCKKGFWVKKRRDFVKGRKGRGDLPPVKKKRQDSKRKQEWGKEILVWEWDGGGWDTRIVWDTNAKKKKRGGRQGSGLPRGHLELSKKWRSATTADVKMRGCPNNEENTNKGKKMEVIENRNKKGVGPQLKGTEDDICRVYRQLRSRGKRKYLEKRLGGEARASNIPISKRRIRLGQWEG